MATNDPDAWYSSNKSDDKGSFDGEFSEGWLSIFFRKPNWNLYSVLLESRKANRYLEIAFSNIFEKKVKTDIGL